MNNVQERGFLKSFDNHVDRKEEEEKMLMIMWLMEARENNFSEHRKSGNV